MVIFGGKIKLRIGTIYQSKTLISEADAGFYRSTDCPQLAHTFYSHQ